MNSFKEKFIGDRNFYRYVLGIAVPMIVQNLITNFVSMLDNIMVGQVGTAQMSGVSIINQFIFVFNLTIFGGVSGASIFGTQFFGKEDHEGQRYTVRFRLILVAIIIAAFAIVFSIFGEPLTNLFLSKDDAPEMVTATLGYGLTYLKIMIISMIPFGIGQAYASAARECGETKVPMMASMVAIGVNLVLDYGLIFGKLGMPLLGVAGAAIATVVAKTVEALVIIFYVHTHTQKFPFVKGLYRGFYIPADLLKRIIVKGLPLLVNEFLWSFGMSTVAQCYSVRGLDVVAARNISSTINNLFGVVYIQLGAAIGIVIGIKLGAGKLKEAKRDTNKLLFFAMMVSIVVALVMVSLAYAFPQFYNTEDAIKHMATLYILIQAAAMPIWCYGNACYFIIRSGGRTGITFLFDFVYTWAVMIPLAFVLTRYTTINIYAVFMIVTYSELLKVVVGYLLVKSGIWIQNIVDA